MIKDKDLLTDGPKPKERKISERATLTLLQNLDKVKGIPIKPLSS